MKQAQEVRAGNVIMVGKDPMVVQKAEFSKSGRNASVVKMKLKNLLSGSPTETIYRADEKFDTIQLEKKDVTYSYFADPCTCSWTASSTSSTSRRTTWATRSTTSRKGSQCELTFYEGRAISVELPNSVDREVAYTEPAVKGDTSGKVMKPAKLANGFEVQVPLFVTTGDKHRDRHAHGRVPPPRLRPSSGRTQNGRFGARFRFPHSVTPGEYSARLRPNARSCQTEPARTLDRMSEAVMRQTILRSRVLQSRVPRHALSFRTGRRGAGRRCACGAVCGQRPRMAASVFHRPLAVESRDADGRMSGEIAGDLGHPFASIARRLIEPAAWCDVIVLHINVKGCAAQGNAVTVYSGRKFYEPLDRTYALRYTFRAVAVRPDYLRIELADRRKRAATAPATTNSCWRPCRRANARSSPCAMRSGRRSRAVSPPPRTWPPWAAASPDSRSSAGTATAAPNGSVASAASCERNAMRNFLALDAWLATCDARDAELTLRRMAALTGQYPAQLVEMPADEYVEMKQRERRENVGH